MIRLSSPFHDLPSATALLAAVFFLLAFLLTAAVACFSLWLLLMAAVACLLLWLLLCCVSSATTFLLKAAVACFSLWLLLMAAVCMSRSAYAYIISRTRRAGPHLLRKD